MSQTRPDSNYRLSQWSSLLLDLLRALMSQIVVLGHLFLFFNVGIVAPPHPQEAAVAGFFVLSGLLITYSSLRKAAGGKYAFPEFFVDRFSRIYVAFIPCLLIVVALDAVAQATHSALYLDKYVTAYNAVELLGNAAMLQDYPLSESVARLFGVDALDLTTFGSARPFWTIAIEWWIYMLFGWLFLASATRRRHPIVWGVVLVPLALIYLLSSVGSGRHSLGGVWAAGALAGWLLYHRRLNWMPSTLVSLMGVVAVLGGFVAVHEFTGSYYTLWFGLPAAVAVLAAVTIVDRSRRAPSARPRRLVHFLANYSLTLYLLHYSLIVVSEPLVGGLPPWVAVAVLLIAVNIVSWAVAQVTEVRYQVVRDWLAAWARRFALRTRTVDRLPRGSG